MKIADWTVEGSGGELLYGSTHESYGEPKRVVLMAHGFKGYKDYGMFPWLAARFAERETLVHRFNFSNSGMTSEGGDFEREDLFEQATWNKQVEDLQILADVFSMRNKPLILFGHSRGGLATLLAVARGSVQAEGVIALSSPSQCNSLSVEDQRKMLVEGRLESPSGRTGQMLYVGKAFVEEQLESPESHDLLALASGIDAKCLLVHGENDATVPSSASILLGEQIPKATVAIIPGGDHVFNTPNPFPIDGVPSPQLQGVWDAISSWL